MSIISLYTFQRQCPWPAATLRVTVPVGVGHDVIPQVLDHVSLGQELLEAAGTPENFHNLSSWLGNRFCRGLPYIL